MVSIEKICKKARNQINKTFEHIASEWSKYSLKIASAHKKLFLFCAV